MDKKLNVLQRSTDKSGWDTSSQLSSTDIKGIKVFTARNDKSLNAIPSPFARIHLFEAAFDLLDKDELNNTNYSGDTFKKIISDCFDVFELIYNWNNHKKEGIPLSIVSWNREGEIEKLKKGTDKHRLLGETFEVFFNHDEYNSFKDISIIKIGDRPIAGSSPFTGFFTTANDLSKINLYNPLNKRNYFSKIIPFKDRKKVIQKYIYDLFNKSSLRELKTTSIVRNYLNKYQYDIDNTIVLNLEGISTPFNHVFNVPLQSYAGRIESDYFEPYLVKINYRINEDCFYLPTNNDQNRKYDYLLPLTPAFFKDFDVDKIPSMININEIDDKSVEITIKNMGKRLYQANKILEQDGKIIDLDNTHSIKLNIGIFPFLKIEGNNLGFNDFYKVMFVCQDNNYRFSNNDFKLSFKINKSLVSPPTEDNYITKIEHRTIIDRNNKTSTGSTYYSLKGRNNENVCFDYIQVQLPTLEENEIKCIIAPKWRVKSVGQKQIDYAIDFGTTTTFIAYTDDPTHTNSPKPFSLDITEDEKDIAVELLNKPQQKEPKSPWIDCYEKALPYFRESIEIQKQEFFPSLINNEKYTTPFRTVLYQKKSISDGQKRLFSNTNIGFTYQKENNNATHINQQFITNLKWNVKTDRSYEESIEIFIEELLHILRIKTLLHDGNPINTRISWFSPLSFTPNAQREYSRIWEMKFQEVCKGISAGHLNNITESEAPFYYYSKVSIIDNPSSVLTLDIGGATTDIMYLRKANPILCSSVYFGANVLWGNGFNEFTNEKENGIYKTIKDNIINQLQLTDLRFLNEQFTSPESPFGSDEIINFWILNDDKTKITRELDNGIFRFSYLLHFFALIYHSFKILKINSHPAPTCIIFSGNGSKYIDFIQKTEYIEKVCSYISEIIFGKSISNLQIILPHINRKESTCYGGLYQPYNRLRTFKPITYLGFEEDDHTFLKYSDIELKKDSVFESLLKAFNEFLEHFFKMNERADLSFRPTFGIEINLNAIKNYLKIKALENLEVGYSKRKKRVDDNDPITDSIFFYPLIGLLFKANTLSITELSDYIPKTRYYAISSEGDKGFLTEALTSQRKPDSIFIITVKEDHPDIGELTIIGEEPVYKRALDSLDGYLKPTCTWTVFPSSPNQSIKTLKQGKVQRVDEYWKIKEKIQIEFI
ncbi:MAG: hypothetical protein NTU98_08215 [Bacteroidetes bacterium]|nr:hypothetical protein [Bacteroidota bacterium]